MNAAKSAATREDLVRIILDRNELNRIETEIEARIEATVRQLRARGESWAVIGGALGTTRQAAFQRYSGRTLM